MATTGGVLVSGPLQALLGAAVSAKRRPEPLGPVPDLRDGIVRLHLPRGFPYRSFHDTDGPPIVLDDGTMLPGRHDGMAAFPRPAATSGWSATTRSTDRGRPAVRPRPTAVRRVRAGRRHDDRSSSPPDGEVIEAFTSLNGTQMNCSGGADAVGQLDLVRGDGQRTRRRRPTSPGRSNASLAAARTASSSRCRRAGCRTAQPITQRRSLRPRGRGLQPATRAIVYLTEDNFEFPSGLYRYIPPVNPMAAGASSTAASSRC